MFDVAWPSDDAVVVSLAVVSVCIRGPSDVPTPDNYLAGSITARACPVNPVQIVAWVSIPPRCARLAAKPLRKGHDLTSVTRIHSVSGTHAFPSPHPPTHHMPDDLRRHPQAGRHSVHRRHNARGRHHIGRHHRTCSCRVYCSQRLCSMLYTVWHEQHSQTARAWAQPAARSPTARCIATLILTATRSGHEAPSPCALLRPMVQNLLQTKCSHKVLQLHVKVCRLPRT